MGYRTTRPHAALKACRLRRYVVPGAVLAWLAGDPMPDDIAAAPRTTDGALAPNTVTN